MNRKLTILVVLFLLVSAMMNAQTIDFICATADDLTIDSSNVYSGSVDPNVLANSEPIVFNMVFWGINQDDGTSDNKLTENDVLKAIASYNIKYNPFNIFFKYRGMNFINSSRFYTVYDSCTQTNNSCYSQLPGFVRENNYQYYNPEAINIYVPRHTVGFAGVAQPWLINIMGSSAFENENGRVITHELAHIIGLGHTHKGWTSTNPDGCEHVTRDPLDIDDPNDPNDTYFNADTKGDSVVDTAAVPDFRNELCDELGYDPPHYEGCTAPKYYYIDLNTCTYDNPEGKDCQETPFEIESPDVRNLMAYSSTCSADLTTGQGIFMREWIVNHPTMFNQAFTSFSSLFEPYKGEYYVAGPLPAHSSPPLFQPGFDYTFVGCECECPQPSPDDTPFTVLQNTVLTISKYETNYSLITHPNHSAIKLEVVLPTLTEPTIRRCYDNYNRAPSGGSITRFNDEVFNTNVTITPQDSTGINNPTLIDNLQQGLYKIEKNYQDGSLQETVIFKENN